MSAQQSRAEPDRNIALADTSHYLTFSNDLGISNYAADVSRLFTIKLNIISYYTQIKTNYSKNNLLSFIFNYENDWKSEELPRIGPKNLS